jgi:hypothetical protein
MLQPGKDLALLAEALAKQFRGKWEVDELDGNPLVKLAVSAMRQVNRAHAAAANQPIKPIRADRPLRRARFSS